VKPFIRTESPEELLVKYFCSEMARKGYVTFIDTKRRCVEVSAAENMTGTYITVEMIHQSKRLSDLCDQVANYIGPPSPKSSHPQRSHWLTDTPTYTYTQSGNNSTSGYTTAANHTTVYSQPTLPITQSKNPIIPNTVADKSSVTKDDLIQLRQEIVQQVADELTRIETLIERLMERD
jgi:hypothetical protein